MAGLYTCNWRPGLPVGADLHALLSATVYNKPVVCVLPTLRTSPEYAQIEQGGIADGMRWVLPPYSKDWWRYGELIEQMDKLGYWGRFHTPFTQGDLYWAGFTAHGMTGWNGTPDYYASAPTLIEAACYAAIMTDESGRAYLDAVPETDLLEIMRA